jgi:hypothetical protein
MLINGISNFGFYRFRGAFVSLGFCLSPSFDRSVEIKLPANSVIKRFWLYYKYEVHCDKICEISGSHGGEYEDDSRLGYCVV